MSELAQRMLAAQGKPIGSSALVVLEDGTVYEGRACGAAGEACGEVCFNTAMEGYLEVVTDPSYAGQVVVMTYPQIGNYGVCTQDVQAPHPALKALVVRDMCYEPSNWRSDLSLPEFLEQESVLAVEGVDTRALVRHIREKGAMRAIVSTEDADIGILLEKVRASDGLAGRNLAQEVSCNEPYRFTAADLPAGRSFALADPPDPRQKVVAYDCGAKRSILEGLVRAGCDVTVVPWDTPASEVLALGPAGVFISNGPGDPDAVQRTYDQVGRLLGEVPMFGICLGHQMLCKAAGAQMQKLKFGHHGGNHPVVNLLTGRVEITSQNHGFNLVYPSLGPLDPVLSGGEGRHRDDLRFWSARATAPVVENRRYGAMRLTHVNLNDGTAEGVAFDDIPAFSVQYHPEACPGPSDAHYLFSAFVRMMDGRKDYLDIDIASDRLQDWRF